MNGNRYFLDTNSLIALLKGSDVLQLKMNSGEWIGTSVICAIEFLSFSNLSSADKDLFYKLFHRIEVIPIDKNISLLEKLASFRSETRLKLPDAIIAATAVIHNSVLFSNDKHFGNIPTLSVLNY
jgi:predicted nucleic acid-binding protein